MKADVIVIGGGLAGAILAWTLREQGASVVVFDRRGLSNCSRVAAGLYHPVTGRRLALSWRVRCLLESGRRLLGSAESRSDRTLFHALPIRRYFVDQAMTETWSRRRTEAQEAGLSIRELPPDPRASIQSDFGGYELDGCGYVDTSALIAAMAAPFRTERRWIEAEIEPGEIDFHADRVFCRDVTADQVVFAQGHLGRANPMWKDLPFRPLHGEILDLRIEGALPPCIHLGPVFLVPRGDGIWNAGATYDRTIETDEPTEKGRRTLEQELHAFLRHPFEVVGHQAGVRPASGDTMPFVGRHPEEPRAWVFNGFGSRSLLMAPYAAEQLAGALLRGSALPEAIDVTRFHRKRHPARPFRTTWAAWERMDEVIRPGDLAVDATAGNGHDTVFLAEKVGPDGQVLALDIQPQAIRITGERLAKTNLLDRVRLVVADHAQLAEQVPIMAPGRLRGIMFNLGSLAHGDPAIRTRPETTLHGFAASLEVLSKGGRLTAVINPVDGAGQEEERLIRNWMADLSSTRFQVEIMTGENPSERDPWLLMVTVR